MYKERNVVINKMAEELRQKKNELVGELAFVLVIRKWPKSGNVS